MDNVNQNVLLEYVMFNSIFESLTQVRRYCYCYYLPDMRDLKPLSTRITFQLLRDTSARNQHGNDVILLLTLLVNYRKHESANPYIVKLSILDDELALNGYNQVISSSLTEFCRQFVQQKAGIVNRRIQIRFF